MKQSHSKLAETVWFALAQKTFPFVIFVLGSASGCFVISILKDNKVKGAENIGGILILVTLIGTFYSIMVLVKLKDDKTLSILDACAHVFYSWLIYFQFLPVVGTWLSKWAKQKARKQNPFVAQSEN